MGVPTAPVSLRLAVSYVVDWIVIIGIAAVGAGLWRKSPNRRPFSPFDPAISFPYVEHEKVSTTVLAIVSVVVPAVVTAALALVLTPSSGGSVSWKGGRNTWRRKFWEWNAAWLGLALALVLTLLFTEGLKDIMGKPRPDLLSRCMLNPDQVQNNVVGGGIAQGALVSWTACRQPDAEVLGDGFQSFPSGHSSFSWCGMFYLTLFLCSKFSIAIPYLLPYPYTPEHGINNDADPIDGVPSEHANDVAIKQHKYTFSRRHQAAAPPAYLFILVLIPVCAATYIASTRYSDFRHHGFDIIFGALLGIFFAWGGFRMYHLPIRRGSGWAWGPRSAERAWGIGIGRQGYVSGRPEDGAGIGSGDVEMGAMREAGIGRETMSNGRPAAAANADANGTVGSEPFRGGATYPHP